MSNPKLMVPTNLQMETVGAAMVWSSLVAQRVEIEVVCWSCEVCYDGEAARLCTLTWLLIAARRGT